MFFDYFKRKKQEKELEIKRQEQIREKKEAAAREEQRLQELRQQEKEQARRENIYRKRRNTIENTFLRGELFPGYVFYWGEPEPTMQTITGEQYKAIKEECQRLFTHPATDLEIITSEARQKPIKEQVSACIDYYDRYKPGSFISLINAQPLPVNHQFIKRGKRREQQRKIEEEKKAFAEKVKKIKDPFLTQDRIDEQIRIAFWELEQDKRREEKRKERERLIEEMKRAKQAEQKEAPQPLPDAGQRKPQPLPVKPKEEPKEEKRQEPRPVPKQEPQPVPIKEGLRQPLPRNRGGRPALLSSQEYKEASDTEQRAMREAYYLELGLKCLAGLPKEKQALFSDAATGKPYKGIIKQIGRASESESEKQYNYIVKKAASMLAAGDSATKTQKAITHLRSNRRA